MKTIMSLMLGLALIAGTATVSFAQDKTGDSTTKKKKGKKKDGTDTATTKRQ